MDRDQAEKEARCWANAAEPGDVEPCHIARSFRTRSAGCSFCGDGPTFVPYGETEVELPTGWGSFVEPAKATCEKCLKGYAEWADARIVELEGVKRQLEQAAVSRDNADTVSAWEAVKLRPNMGAVMTGRGELLIFTADRVEIEDGEMRLLGGSVSKVNVLRRADVHAAVSKVDGYSAPPLRSLRDVLKAHGHGVAVAARNAVCMHGGVSGQPCQKCGGG